MCIAEQQIPLICARGYWTYHTCAAGPDHVHTILTSDHDPEVIRRLLKRWLGQELTAHFHNEPGCPQPGTGVTWWAECGSIKWIGDDRYFTRATDYVTRQRATAAGE